MTCPGSQSHLRNRAGQESATPIAPVCHLANSDSFNAIAPSDPEERKNRVCRPEDGLNHPSIIRSFGLHHQHITEFPADESAYFAFAQDLSQVRTCARFSPPTSAKASGIFFNPAIDLSPDFFSEQRSSWPVNGKLRSSVLVLWAAGTSA